MTHDDVALADRLTDGAVQRVEEFGQWHGGRSRVAGVLVGPGVGDDELVGGGTDRVEQQLAVLRPDVTLTGHRGTRQRVVTVDHADPRKDRVVQANQAHHPMRYRAHRHHGAHRQRAGSEVGPRRPPGQVATQQRDDVR